jgi:hypothetical protein
MHERGGNFFQLRHNLDGTHDSICCVCCGTVARTWEEFELARHELAHTCDPAQLYLTSQFAPHAMRNQPALNPKHEHPGPAAA